MAIIYFLTVISSFLFMPIFCYDNLSRRNTTKVSLSSVYESWNAALANDGIRTHTDYKLCSHTAYEFQEAWLQVDLKDYFSLKSVKIYYRDETGWPPRRFRQFYLDVSNSSVNVTSTSQRVRCYKDETEEPDVPQSVIDIPCRHAARYIIVGTSYDAPEDNPIEGAILEICEIEVYGCGIGKFGELCKNCQCSTCSIINGSCPVSCSDNCRNTTCTSFSGYCTNGCKERYYGPKCEHLCSSQCNSQSCDQVSGECTACNNGYYGPYCNQTCSPFCEYNICDFLTGECQHGCKSNWTGDFCNKCNGSHFGQNCSEKCNINCKGQMCNNITGACTNGCEMGYFKETCNKSCSPYCLNGCDSVSGYCDDGCVEGKFGTECNKNCGIGCLSKSCARINGNCTCADGWKGDKCTELQTSEIYERTETNEVPPIYFLGAGGGGAFLLFIVVIIVIIVCKSRRHTNSDDPSTFEIHMPSDRNTAGYTNRAFLSVPIEDPEEEPYEEKPEEAVYYNNLSMAKDISVKDLANIIKQKEENEGFIKEFKSLPYGVRFECKTATLEGNLPKNRFKTVFPYDHSRVLLETTDGFSSDYINANYIENMTGIREYIACQGPLPNTVVDFWRMVWQGDVEYIVMLTNLIEGPKVKCHQYWPNEGTEVYFGPFSVRLIEEKVYANHVVRTINLRQDKVTGSRTIVQFHFTSWPDHGTPNPLSLLFFLRHFRHKIRPSHHPIIVHCSAGIGRTGTFIALDVLSRFGDEKGKINVIEFVKSMRKDRMTMVQNADQYAFLYYALHEYFKSKRNFVGRREFIELYGDTGRQETRKRLRNEFNVVTSLKPNYEEDDFKTGHKNDMLNFTNSVLPVDRYLVQFTSTVKGRGQYYNAVNVSSFTRADEFIAAQYPASGAAIDLVRLLVDQDSSFLISLNPLSEIKELVDWVDDGIKSVKLTPYEICKITSTMMSNALRKTDIQIKRKHSNQIHIVHIFDCLDWNSNEILPREPTTITDLIKHFCLERKRKQDGPITIVSGDGATSCGLFIAVYNAIEQLQQDDEVDLFTIVQQLQCRRPEMISTKEEYEFCFKTVCDYLNSDNVYANT